MPVGLVAAAALAVAPDALAVDPPLLYLHEEPAVAIDAALGGGTLRQAPHGTNARWTGARSVGKLSGRELAGLSAARQAAAMRAALRAAGPGGLVGIDEISPARWSGAEAAALRQALISLGPSAGRIIVYAAPSLVERVGRADPRRPLPPALAALVDAVSHARATYLMTYRGDLNPLPEREMATHPTRWAARWPAGRGELRLLLGPDGGIGQAELWRRARSTPAGRAMLADGPGAYGLRTVSVARDWAAQYIAFRAAPTVSASGVDFPVTTPGGLRLAAAGTARVRLTAARPGRVVLTIQPTAGGRRRAFKKLTLGGPATVVVGLPRDSKPGLQRVRATLLGDGLTDRASVVVRMPKRR